MPCPAWSSSRPGVATTISRPGAKGPDLRIESHAAVDGRRADGTLRPVGSDALLDLEGELAGGGQDEAADRQARGAAAARLARRQAPRLGAAGVEELQDRQHEGGRLAGARLGAGEKVAAGEHLGDGFGLDRGGFGIPLRRDGTEELGRQPEVFEGHRESAPEMAHPLGICSGDRSGREVDRDRTAEKPGRRPERPFVHEGVNHTTSCVSDRMFENATSAAMLERAAIRQDDVRRRR